MSSWEELVEKSKTYEPDDQGMSVAPEKIAPPQKTEPQTQKTEGKKPNLKERIKSAAHIIKEKSKPIISKAKKKGKEVVAYVKREVGPATKRAIKTTGKVINPVATKVATTVKKKIEEHKTRALPSKPKEIPSTFEPVQETTGVRQKVGEKAIGVLVKGREKFGLPTDYETVDIATGMVKGASFGLLAPKSPVLTKTGAVAETATSLMSGEFVIGPAVSKAVEATAKKVSKATQVVKTKITGQQLTGTGDEVIKGVTHISGETQVSDIFGTKTYPTSGTVKFVSKEAGTVRVGFKPEVSGAITDVSGVVKITQPGQTTFKVVDSRVGSTISTVVEKTAGITTPKISYTQTGKLLNTEVGKFRGEELQNIIKFMSPNDKGVEFVRVGGELLSGRTKITYKLGELGLRGTQPFEFNIMPISHAPKLSISGAELEKAGITIKKVGTSDVLKNIYGTVSKARSYTPSSSSGLVTELISKPKVKATMAFQTVSAVVGKAGAELAKGLRAKEVGLTAKEITSKVFKVQTVGSIGKIKAPQIKLPTPKQKEEITLTPAVTKQPTVKSGGRLLTILSKKMKTPSRQKYKPTTVSILTPKPKTKRYQAPKLKVKPITMPKTKIKLVTVSAPRTRQPSTSMPQPRPLIAPFKVKKPTKRKVKKTKVSRKKTNKKKTKRDFLAIPDIITVGKWKWQTKKFGKFPIPKQTKKARKDYLKAFISKPHRFNPFKKTKSNF